MQKKPLHPVNGYFNIQSLWLIHPTSMLKMLQAPSTVTISALTAISVVKPLQTISPATKMAVIPMSSSSPGIPKRKHNACHTGNPCGIPECLPLSAERGSRLKWLPVLDEYTRECLSLEVDRSITARYVVETLEKLVEERGVPEFIRSDNGPEFIADAVKEWIAANGMKTLYIEPGAPWQNPYSESFNARFRDEFLNVELFSSLLEAKVLGREHQEKYNHLRPHSSLGILSPAEFGARCLAALRAWKNIQILFSGHHGI